MFRCLALGFALVAISVHAADVPRSNPAQPTAKPLVIAHRGASASLPEHTLAAYARAIGEGADYIEPDLVATRDGVLVARHENEIGGTTDVAAHPEFASRRTTRTVDGHELEGWFVEDFTLDELRTLRARERLPQLRSTAFDGRYPVPTFDEIVDLVAREATARGRVIGLIPEIKHSSYFIARGLPMEERLLDALAAHPYTRTAPVVIQSFETANLRALRARLGDDRANIRRPARHRVLCRHPRTAPGLCGRRGRRWPPRRADPAGGCGACRRVAGDALHLPPGEPLPAAQPVAGRGPAQPQRGRRGGAHPGAAGGRHRWLLHR